MGPILTLYTLAQLNSIAVASADGRLILYDLTNLEAYHMAYPPELNSPILKMCLLEPAHDPRACLYLWAFHHNYDNAFAVMHSITFSRKVNDSGFIRYLVSCINYIITQFNHIDEMFFRILHHQQLD